MPSPRPARRYDFYLPLTYNDGRSIEREKFDAVEKKLMTRFQGLTSHRREFPLKGIWQGNQRLFIDQVVIITVLDFRPRGSPGFVAEVKKFLLREFKQEDILITETILRVH